MLKLARNGSSWRRSGKDFAYFHVIYALLKLVIQLGKNISVKQQFHFHIYCIDAFRMRKIYWSFLFEIFSSHNEIATFSSESNCQVYPLELQELLVTSAVQLSSVEDILWTPAASVLGSRELEQLKVEKVNLDEQYNWTGVEGGNN